MNSPTSPTETSEGAASPQDLYRLFAERANAGDLDGLVALYEADAALAPQPGMLASGSEQVRAALGQLLAMGAQFRIEPGKQLIAGDVALLSGTWTATATGPDGNPMTMRGTDGVVARRQPDGSWLMAIDDPNFIA